MSDGIFDYSPKLAFLCGSLRTGSINKRLVDAMMVRVEPMGATADFIDFNAYEMPLYHGDNDAPETVSAFIETMVAYDGIVIVTPEYNGGLPPLLKNVVDWTSTVSTRWIKGKTFGVAACTPGPMSGIMAMRELAFLLRRLGGDVVPMQVGVGNAATSFDAEGNLIGQPGSDFADQMLQSVIDMARRKNPQPDA